jgi:hypothetical protein
MVLWRIFGPKRDEVTADWRMLHNEELHKLYSSPNIIRMIKSRRMRWARHVEGMGDEECIYDIGGRARRKETTRKTNIKMDLREIGWDGVDWIELAQDREQWRALVNTVMNLWVP